MPNGHRSPSGSSPLHTSDSEDRVVLKARRKILRRRVLRRWRLCVRVRRKRRLRAVAERIHYFLRLQPEICARIAGFVIN